MEIRRGGMLDPSDSCFTISLWIMGMLDEFVEVERNPRKRSVGTGDTVLRKKSKVCLSSADLLTLLRSLPLFSNVFSPSPYQT